MGPGAEGVLLAWTGGLPPGWLVFATFEEVGCTGKLIDDALLGASHALGDGDAFEAELLADLGVAEALKTEMGNGALLRGEPLEDAHDEFALDETIQRMKISRIAHRLRSIAWRFRPVVVTHWQISSHKIEHMFYFNYTTKLPTLLHLFRRILVYS